MKQIIICNKSEVPKHVHRSGVTHIISLMDPHTRPYIPEQFNKNNWKIQYFEDNDNPKHHNAPRREHIDFILEYTKTIPNDAVLLVHCLAGISRSTAGTLGILLQKNGKDKIAESITELIEIRPIAHPNRLIVAYLDSIFGYDGKLEIAVHEAFSKWWEYPQTFVDKNQ
jgi:predicted protein tyrosine phosphatase